MLLRKTLHFLIDFVHRVPQKQENHSEGFNFIESTLNVVNSKFVQPIDSEESNSGINTNKTFARLVSYKFPIKVIILLLSNLHYRRDSNNSQSESMLKEQH